MRKKNFFFVLLFFLLIGAFFFFDRRIKAQETDSLIAQEPFLASLLVPGIIEGKGISFEIKNSEYLNISLKSTEEITILLESIPKMISLNITSSTNATSTNLTIEGLEPNKTYYQYQDSYKNESIFISSENGTYSWNQDLTQSHHIWIQEIKGTRYIDKDTILDSDITGSVEITADDVTLDCNGHTITGSDTGYGIYSANRNGVTIKNCHISHFSYGIYSQNINNSNITDNTIYSNTGVGVYLVKDCNNNTIADNTIYSNGWYGIYLSLSFSRNNTIVNNTIYSNNYYGIDLHGSLGNNTISNNTVYLNSCGICAYASYSDTISGNTILNNAGGIVFWESSNYTISNNNISGNKYGIHISFYSTGNTFFGNNLLNNDYAINIRSSSNSNLFYHNNFKASTSRQVYTENSNLFDKGYPIGGNYWSDYTGLDEKSGENQDQEGSDGIGDTPYTFNGGQDKYPFMKENGWEIPINQLPVAKINYTPRNPVKGMKVNFDASLSTDPDGKITQFEWHIASSTLFGTTTSFVFNENGQYEITLIVTDNEGATSSTSTIIKIEPFSFAIITDLHIGWGIPDYNSEGFDEATEYLLNEKLDTQDYYITQRLQKAVEWINENYEQKNIKFVVVLGDISDTAEYSEFIKAREILNKLEIPYVPLIGNHDIWPYIQKITADPDNRLFSMKERANSAFGQLYFDIVFWEQNATNTRKIKELFDSFERQEDLPEYQGSLYLQNYAFSFGGVNFIALDFATRNYLKLLKTPFNETLHPETFNWFKEKLQNCQENPEIILAHYPFVGLRTGFSPFDLEQIDQYIKDSQCKLINLGGHTHRNEISSKDYYEVVETEPISQIKLSYALTGHPIRIIEIETYESIEYHSLEGNFLPSINPFITANKEKAIIGKPIKFYANVKNVNPENLSPFEWEFEGNPDVFCFSTRGSLNNVCEATYNTEGNYEVKLKAALRENPNYFEEISINIRAEREPRLWWKIFLPFDNFKAFLNDLTQVDLTKDENTQYSSEWVTIEKVSSPLIPIGSFMINHEKAIGQVDLSKARFDIDIQAFKALFYIPEENQEIERSKILYLPF